ncbi:MAG: Rpp14/Pop5 family protein [archaeon]|nr:Rpp14/Pop5 family protein [archaeon]
MQKKKSLNPIPLSLRDRKRYIVFEVLCSKKFSEQETINAMNKTFLQLFGEIGVSKMNYSTVLFNSSTNKGIMKTNNDSLVEAKSAILFLKSIASISVIPKILFVSGTINKAKTKLK